MLYYTTARLLEQQQQQQQQLEEDDDEESALCRDPMSYGSVTLHLPPPPPPVGGSRRQKRTDDQDFVLPALDPKAEEVMAAMPSPQQPRYHQQQQHQHHHYHQQQQQQRASHQHLLLRRRPAKVNLSTIRANYKISRHHIRENQPKVCGLIQEIKNYLHYDAYASIVKSILLANYTIVLFVNLDLVVDLLMCCAYLAEMKQGYDIGLSPTWLFKRRSHELWVLCQVLSLWNICSYAIRFFISRIPISVLFSFRGLTELLTSIPLLASRFIPHGQYIYVPYFLRSWVFLLRIKSALKIKVTLRMTDKHMDALQYKQIYLIGTIVILLYNGMAGFQYSEAIFGKRQCSVLDSLYAVVVTLSTVGYGDITPSATGSRIVMILLIMVTVAVIPGLVSDFLETMHKRDVTGGHVIKDAHPFILIVGTFTVEQAKETLNGFLNMENTDGKLSVVFLDTKHLTDELKLLGRNSVWGHRIHFLHSNCLDEKTLQRAQAQYARAIFTISDSNAPDPVKEDERNTVRLWTLHCYTARHNVPIYTYNLSPSTAIYQKVAKEVICVRQFNQYLLALNCRCRGASTLLTNLLHRRDPLNKYDAPWEAQYDDGSCNEIYTAPATACIVGISFRHAAWLLYKEFQVVLFALRVHDDEIILNPYSNNKHIIQETDTCIYIAQSLKDIRDMENLNSAYVWQTIRIHEYSRAIHLPPVKLQVDDQQEKTSAMTSSHHDPARSQEKPFHVSRLPTSSLSLLIGIGTGIGPISKSSPPSDKDDIYDDDDYDDDDDDDDNLNVGGGNGSRSTPPLACYLLHEPATLDDVVIHTTAGIRNHILVCMHQEFTNIFKFIYNLRSPHLQPEELQDIVLLCTELPSQKTFHPISIFPRVYIMEGNCRQPDDILRAGIKRAKQVVVMSEKESQEHHKTDSAAIMTSHIIHLLLNRCKSQDSAYTIVNLVERTNIKFMHLLQGKQVDDGDVDVFYTPAYAAGDVVAESLISNVLLSQTYSKPEVVQVIRAMSGMPTTRTSTYYDKKPKCKRDPGLAASAKLTMLHVPDYLVGHTFMELFEMLLLDQGILALGLLRAPADQFGNELPFVYTNPVPALILLESDLVYVLAHSFLP